MHSISKYLHRAGLAVGMLYFAGFGLAPMLASAATTVPIKVMPLGDSITDGFVVPGGYRTQLWQRTVQTDGDNIDYVGSVNDGPATLGDKDNEGHVGWCLDGLPCGKANDMVAYIDSWMAASQPDIILLHGGTNDINDGFTGAQTATHLDTLLGKIYADKPSVDVIVAKIIPAGEGAVKLQAWKDYEAAIPGIVSKYSGLGDNIQMVDMSTLLTLNTPDYYQSTPGGGYDTLHPSQAGYNKMADAWYPALTASYQALAGTTTPPPTPINYFANCDTSVESSASCWTGVYSANSKVTWVSGDGQDGTHSIRYTSPTSTTAAAGVNAKPAPVTSTTPGITFTGGAWVRASAPNITITLGLREKRADNSSPGYTLTSWKATDTNWHFLTSVYTTNETGNSLTYSIYSPSLPSGAYVDSDVFSLTSPGTTPSTPATPPSGTTTPPATTDPTPPPTTTDPTPPPVTTPPPATSTGYFAGCDVSVETSASCWTGFYSANSMVSWAANDGQDGTHSIRYSSPSSTNAAAGVNAKPAPVTSTVPGVTFTAGVWVRASQPGITINLGLREKRSDNTAPGYASYSWVATDTNWHYLTGTYTTKEAGNSLTYSVYSPSLPSGAYVDSDVFSLTSK